MTKVIFFDVDGTLLSHKQKAVPTSTKRSIEKLKKKGIHCVIATGRHMLEMAELPLDDIDFDGYITMNGQLCLDNKGNIIHANPIQGESKDNIIQLFNNKEIPIMIVEKDALYINFVNQYVKYAQEAISTSIPEVKEYSGNDFYLAIAYIENKEEKILFEQLKECSIFRWNDYAVDIFPNTSGKTIGIKKYIDRNNISIKDTMAFGDGENDIEMLEFVQVGIAMGNAYDEVKKHADYITSSIDEDGIEKALIDLGIIDHNHA